MIRRFLFLTAIFILFGVFPSGVAAQEECGQLIWADEFDGEGSPDISNWNFETGGGGWGNNELQVYTNSRSNSYVSNGTLKIHARRNNGNWTSARMVTAGKASWKHGRFEIRAKLPAGRGTWPALWMMPQSSVYGGWPKSGEIDIMEHVGYDPGRIHGSIHTEAYNHKIGTQKGGNVMISTATTQFHTYAVEWSENQITWSVDGNAYYTFVNENKTYKEWPFDQPFFLIFNIAIGGDWGAVQGIDPSLTEAVMEIDYVRVYSNSLPRPVIQGPAFVTPGQQALFTVDKPLQAEYNWIFPDGTTLVSGGGTPAVTVIWGDQPGEVIAEVRNSCDTVSSAPFNVGLLTVPTGEYWSIPFEGSDNQLLWEAFPGDLNQITLRTENEELVVTYNIQNPSGNPHILYQFPAVTDLGRMKQMDFQMKAEKGSEPSNIRIDLVDASGKVDLNDLFKIDIYIGTGQFTTHTKLFAMKTSGDWDPTRIAMVRVYFNYGILGKKGSGEFRLKEMKLKDPNYVAAPLIDKKKEMKIWPNPASRSIEISSPDLFSRISLINLQGQTVISQTFSSTLTKKIDLSHLTMGVYFLIVSDSNGFNQKCMIVKE